MTMPQFALILPAGGSSSRFGGAHNKLLHVVSGRTVLARCIDAFLSRSDVAVVVIPVGGALRRAIGDDPELRARCDEPRVRLCDGGENRAISVYNGLRQVPQPIEWVAVHDAARPLVSQELIDRTISAALKHGAAVPALPVHLTIKQAVGPLPAKVQRTLPRQQLWAMQTPQVMRRADLLSAFERCPIPLHQVTDDVQLLELQGQEVWLVSGEERNLKITTRSDVHLAEAFVAQSGDQNKPRSDIS
jgi:2-C-methyl-D-erythritol 4-phosphate cytidylyltransferase